jgi:hypothetical protein
MINAFSKSPSSQQGTARYTLFLVLGCVTLLALGCGNSSTTPVPGRHLLTITLQPATAEATAPTGTLPFTASGTFDQPPATEDNLAVQWTSSDPSVATIDSTGTATCVAVGGPVTIMASSSQKSGTAQLDCVSVPQVGSGNCAYMCGGTRCGALTGYCSLSTGNACKQVYDPGQCPQGKPAGQTATDPCGVGVDTTRSCTN